MGQIREEGSAEACWCSTAELRRARAAGPAAELVYPFAAESMRTRFGTRCKEAPSLASASEEPSTASHELDVSTAPDGGALLGGTGPRSGLPHSVRPRNQKLGRARPRPLEASTNLTLGGRGAAGTP